MQQPSSTNLLTAYGPLGLSALVIIGLLIGWLIGSISLTTAMSFILPILATWGVVIVGTKQSLATIQGSAIAAARRPAYMPRRASSQPEEEGEHA